jgi:hypothetical protein
MTRPTGGLNDWMKTEYQWVTIMQDTGNQALEGVFSLGLHVHFWKEPLSDAGPAWKRTPPRLARLSMQP